MDWSVRRMCFFHNRRKKQELTSDQERKKISKSQDHSLMEQVIIPVFFHAALWIDIPESFFFLFYIGLNHIHRDRLQGI